MDLAKQEAARALEINGKINGKNNIISTLLARIECRLGNKKSSLAHFDFLVNENIGSEDVFDSQTTPARKRNLKNKRRVRDKARKLRREIIDSGCQ